MISPVSFTGTFKVNNQYPNTDYKLRSFKKFISKNISSHEIYTVSRQEIIKQNYFGAIEPKAEETLIVPDEFDKDVQEFCEINGIKFEKLYTHDLLDSRKITSRIKSAPPGYKKVDIDSDKLEEIVQNQKSNISTFKKEYRNHFFQAAKAMILEGSDFSTTTLRINPKEEYLTFGDTADDYLKTYVETFSAEHLNHEQISIDFVKSPNSVDCYSYFALQDLDLKKIPVYVDDLTYKAGSALGLFIED